MAKSPKKTIKKKTTKKKTTKKKIAKKKTAVKKTVKTLAVKKKDQLSDEVLNFHYIKSNFFRVIKADGVHGGVTPRGDVQLSFFNERLPIPVVESFKVTNEGKIFGLKERRTKIGYVREVESEVVMDVQSARELVKWLEATVLEAEKIRGKKK